VRRQVRVLLFVAADIPLKQLLRRPGLGLGHQKLAFCVDQIGNQDASRYSRLFG